MISIYKFCPQCSSKLIEDNIEGEKVKKCNECGFVFWNNSKPVVSALIHKDGKVLMLQRSNEPFKDFWVLPGGFTKTMETAEEAVEREAKEEIGSNIKIERILGTYLIDNDPRGIHLDIIFLSRIDGEVTLSEEDKNFDFFDPEKLPENIAYKHRDAINDWINSLSK